MAGLSILSVIRLTQWRTARDRAKDELHRQSGCKGRWRKRDGKYGTFWGCSKWPECHITKDYDFYD